MGLVIIRAGSRFVGIEEGMITDVMVEQESLPVKGGGFREKFTIEIRTKDTFMRIGDKYQFRSFDSLRELRDSITCYDCKVWHGAAFNKVFFGREDGKDA